MNVPIDFLEPGCAVRDADGNWFGVADIEKGNCSIWVGKKGLLGLLLHTEITGYKDKTGMLLWERPKDDDETHAEKTAKETTTQAQARKRETMSAKQKATQLLDGKESEYSDGYSGREVRLYEAGYAQGRADLVAEAEKKAMIVPSTLGQRGILLSDLKKLTEEP